MKKGKEIFEIIFAIIGAFVGAGFASGKEIYLFFYLYGKNGILGIFISMFILVIVIYKTFKIIKENDIKNYDEFLNAIFTKKLNNIANKKITRNKNGDFSKNNLTKKINNTANKKIIIEIINNIINIFLIISLFIMFAGFGAYLNQQYNINKYIGSGILCILCYFILLKDVKGILKINKILVPAIIIIISLFGVTTLEKINYLENNFIHNNSINWILQSILYGSYNTVLLIPVLITLEKNIKRFDNNNIFIISLFSGIIIFILTIIIFLLLAYSNVNLEKFDMPIIYVIKRYFYKFNLIYGAIILISIFTTSISLGVGVLKNICKNQKSYPQFVLILCITGFLFSGFGFSNLVSCLYPILGFFGVFQIINILTS